MAENTGISWAHSSVRWGFHRLIMVNSFAYRVTSQRRLLEWLIHPRR